MTDSQEVSTTESKSSVTDFIALLLLSVTAVLTAWCGFQSSKWGGEMSIAFSEASSLRVQATSAESRARDARQYDLSIYIEWVLADRDRGLRTYIEERFTPEFKVAFDAWNSGGRSQSGPLAHPKYTPSGTEEALRLDQLADDRFQSALKNNQQGDNYTLLTVAFALVLFLTALSQRNQPQTARKILLTLAIVVAVVSVVIMLTFPVRI